MQGHREGGFTVVRQAQERRCGGSTTAACSSAAMSPQGRLCVADSACMGARLMRHASIGSQPLGCLHLAPKPSTSPNPPVGCPNDQHLPPVCQPIHERQQHTHNAGKYLVRPTRPAGRRAGSQVWHHPGSWRQAVTHLVVHTPALAEREPSKARCATLCCALPKEVTVETRTLTDSLQARANRFKLDK